MDKRRRKRVGRHPVRFPTPDDDTISRVPPSPLHCGVNPISTKVAHAGYTQLIVLARPPLHA